MSKIFRLLLLLSICSLSSSTTWGEQDWPQWRGPNRDDMSSESGLLTTWPEGGPERVWMFEDCGVGYGGPAIVDNRIFIMGGRNNEAQLICLDASEGIELWHTKLGELYENDWGNGPRSTPTVDGEFIYALASKGDLICLSRADGSKVWSASLTELGGEIPNWGYAESPLIHGDMVLCTPGGDQGTIAAFDKRTGEVLWQSKDITDKAHYSSIVTMNVNGRETGVQLLEKQLVGFDLKDGALLWSEPWPGRVAVIPTPIVEGNQVYVSSGYGAGCMMLRIGDDFTPERVYDNKVLVNHHGGVIKLGDHLFGYSDKKGWVCQEFATGEQKWRDRDAFGKGAIAYADNHFYCLSEEGGEVALISPSTEGWEEQGRFTLDPQTELRKPRGMVWVHPVILNGRLYLRDQDLVYCYDVSTKKIAGRPTTGSSN